MRTPIVLVTGVDPDAMASVLVGLAWDLPRAVSVRHVIDPDEQTLTRVVSDADGVLDKEVIPLEHACTGCALREDIVPTIERLARDGRWNTVIACLPLGAEAVQVDHVVAGDSRLQRHLRIAAVVTALDGANIVDDLLGDDLLRERGRHSGPDDARGHGEVACAMVEYADVVVLSSETETQPSPVGTELVRTLARPDACVVPRSEEVDASLLTSMLHDHERTARWIAPVLMDGLPQRRERGVWQLVLDSPRPFHPDRLLDDIERLGGGRHRSRGAFWLPTRPDVVQVWDGAGGQLSIGAGAPWSEVTPRTRILFTGAGTAPDHLHDAFEAMLLGPVEALVETPNWAVPEDGFEPWLGPIRDIA
ncbi:MAG: GTP-binding protein [Nocardioides sp.]|uniref:CobW family GTP-binding protein n=1 Tax=Nocardioides sp. TaxID=35761 RepID=UPI0039E4A54D